MTIDIYNKHGEYLCTTEQYTRTTKAVNAIEGEIALKDFAIVAGSNRKITIADCPLKGKKKK